MLSGPSFAAEVARDLPTAVTIASRDAGASPARFMAALGTARFRPYLSQDPIGAEIGGAVKNVLAIACGIIDGRGLGDNARAALITRGLAEMVRLGLAKGADAGHLPRPVRARRPGADLHRRRNRATTRWGVALGRGTSLAEALSGSRSVVEGVATAAAVAELAARARTSRCRSPRRSMAVLHRGMAIRRMIERSCCRPYRSE